MTDVPRPEYPRPQMVRQDWLCLNGPWQFEVDRSDTGLERGLRERDLEREIVVPFCPESPLSGIGDPDFMNAVWYRREVRLPEAWRGRRVLLHFQAVDYDTTIWVNGIEVARHRGGFTPISCELSGVAEPGEQAIIVVRARDDARRQQPRGKQSSRYGNYGCYYTRTTGIWQSVWLEPVPEVSLSRPRLLPDLAGSRFTLSQPVTARGSTRGLRVRATLSDPQGQVVASEAPLAGLCAQLALNIPADRQRLWSCDDPHLYGVKIELVDAEGHTVDEVGSYAGLRCLTIDGQAILLNGKPLFQRLVLDQGYYPDGILTAPSDEALVHDIELAMKAGFNGARLHQKVFEERFLYHADRLGYLCWAEFADWGFLGRGSERAVAGEQPAASLMTQWAQVLERDISHPAIIGWCPLNETMEPLGDDVTMLDDVTQGLYAMTKLADPTRPVLDASGYSHRVAFADVYDCHDYDQDPQSLRERHSKLVEGQAFVNRAPGDKAASVPYRGQPFFVSEFGGIWWNPDAKPGEQSWGYGARPQSLEEVYERFAGLCDALLDNPSMFGYCYTQLTDVYQEQNGIYRFDRSAKFDAERLRQIQTRPAAIECEPPGTSVRPA